MGFSGKTSLGLPLSSPYFIPRSTTGSDMMNGGTDVESRVDAPSSREDAFVTAVTVCHEVQTSRNSVTRQSEHNIGLVRSALKTVDM